MNSLLDKYGNLNIEDLVVNQPSFKRIIEDGVITEEEIDEQSQRVVAKIKEIESIATPDVKEKMRELLAEMSVLVAISNLKESLLPMSKSIIVVSVDTSFISTMSSVPILSVGK